jgi:hypothetical protein
LLWQPVTARQAPEETPGDGRAMVRQRTTTIVREPEQAWWDAQERHAEPEPAVTVKPAETARSTVTVAAVHDWDAEHDAAAVTHRLADLAVDDELLVVFGADRHARPAHWAMLAGLRTRLPRHDVVAVAVRPDLARLLVRLLEAGSLPVVLTEADAMHDLTAELASLVRADRVVRVFRTSTGADLYPVWRRAGLN